MRTLTSAAELIEASGNDVQVRGTMRREFVAAWEHLGAIAWVGLDSEDQFDHIIVIGETDSAVELLTEIRPLLHLSNAWVAVERPIAAEVKRAGLQFRRTDEWELRWTYSRPPLDDVGTVRWLEDDDAIGALLDAYAPQSSARPGDRHVRGWAAAFDGDELVAVAADTTSSEIGHISSVATRRDRRGQGWGARVTSWLARQQLDNGCAAVSLGMFAANETAIRLYTRLGFTHVRQMTSGPMEDLCEGSGSPSA